MKSLHLSEPVFLWIFVSISAGVAVGQTEVFFRLADSKFRPINFIIIYNFSYLRIFTRQKTPGFKILNLTQ
jgi:hypothetical protein